MLDQPSLRVIQLTPPGRGAIATLRVEGATAVAAVDACFRAGSGRPLSVFAVDRLAVGRFAGAAGEPGEEVVVRRCSDGAVEIHCHGGRAAAARIEELLAAAGSQSVPWRDWARDFCGDPFAAAAWIALAEARTERTAAILLDQFHGALRRALDDIREAAAHGRHDLARQQIEVLAARALLGRRLVEPWRVVFGGPANVGKSSLINALLGYGRSIVHDVAGTTRDAVTAMTAIDGWLVELCDTAGLRVVAEEGPPLPGATAGPASPTAGSPGATAGSSSSATNAAGQAEPCPEHGGGTHHFASAGALASVEAAGIELAKERLARADLVVLVFDQSISWSDDDELLGRQWPDALVVHNKADLPPAPGARPAGLSVSALHGQGLAEVLAAISSRLVPEPPAPGAAVPLNDEQLQAILALGTMCPS
jgi:tRNA modification GTPase